MECWRRRTILERKSLVTLIVLVLFLVVLITLILLVTEPEYCYSNACIEASHYISQLINPSGKICDNFYNYTCSTKPQKKTPNRFLKDIIAEPLNANDTKSFRLQKQFYHSCVDLKAIDSDNDTSFKEILTNIGGWPVVLGNNWNESAFDFTEFMVELRDKGLQHDWFLDISVYSNWGNLVVLEINLPDSANKIYEEEEAAYCDLMTRVAVALGAHESVARVQMKEVMYFEQKLANLLEKIQGKNEERYRDRPLQLVSISEVQKKWQKLNWLELINQLTKRRLQDDQLVAFYVENYMPELDKLLKHTTKRTQVNYVVWKIVETYTPFLSQTIRKLTHNFTLVTNQPDLWYTNRQEFCFEEAKSYFQYTLQAAYVRRHVTGSKRRHVEDLIGRILSEIAKHVEEVGWMNGEVRRVAISKIQNVSYVIGGPEEMYHAEEFDKTFGIENTELNSTNIIPVSIEIYNRTLETLYDKKTREPNFSKSTFYGSVTSTEVAFYPGLNLLWIPAGSLHGFLYEQDRPNALNFGAIGTTIAYELVHGLYSGIYQQIHSTFGSNSTLKKFNEAISCLQNCTDGLSDDETMQCSDNLDVLFDFLAINLSYEAYAKWVKHHGPEGHLKDLFFNNKQLFWLAYGTSTCVPELNSAFQSFRVVNALRNSPHFSRDFRCESGTNMNPERKCKV